MAISETKISKCPPAEELTTLLYDELAPAEREQFENHLADCFACVDEFAELSEARLSAYEWNRDEFAYIPTPVISIDYSQAASGWRVFLKHRLAFAVPAVAFGAVALAIITGYITFAGRGFAEPENQTTAEASPLVEVPVKVVTPTVERAVEPTGSSGVERPQVVRVASAKPRNERKALSRKAAVPTKLVAERNETLVARQPSLPRLTSTAEVRDTTLRLADVFSELEVNE